MPQKYEEDGQEIGNNW